MSEWHHSKNRHNSDFRKLLLERLGKNNPRRKLTAAEERRLSKLEAISVKITRGENVQNLQQIRILNQSGVVHGLIIYAFSFT
jgi:hypothetical protein